MQIIKPKDFAPAKAWQAIDIERIDNASVRLHWTDQPYIWHVNDGPEVFAVLDGSVDMHTRVDGRVTVTRLETGHIFHAETGDEHVAHPVGPARVLVIEQAGSV